MIFGTLSRPTMVERSSSSSWIVNATMLLMAPMITFTRVSPKYLKKNNSATNSKTMLSRLLWNMSFWTSRAKSASSKSSHPSSSLSV